MIRPIDIRLNAAHPELPLAEAVTFTGAPSTVLIRGVPPNCGRWAITAVSVAATYPDGPTTTRAAVQSANGVWVATLPATARSGRTENGLRVMADGIDENGAAVTGYILGVADFAVASLGVTPAPEPGETSWQMLYFDEVPGVLRKGDVAKVDGVLKLYNGTAWEAFAGDIPAPSTATPAMDGTGSAGSASAYSRGDHVHPTDTSRMAASATGADIAVSGTDATKISAALAGKRDKTDMSCTVAVTGIPQIGSGNFVVTSPSGTSTALTPFDSSGVIGWGWYRTYPYIFARASNSYDIIFGLGISDIIPLDMTAKTQTVTYNGETWTVDAFTGATVNTRLANMTDIPAPSTATPAMDGTGAAGTSAAFARGDHVHPSDTSKQNALTAQQLANIAAVSDALAFDATHSYAAGDPVVYNGTLYTFTAAHTGAWTGTDVSAVDIIAMLAGKLDKVNPNSGYASISWNLATGSLEFITPNGESVHFPVSAYDGTYFATKTDLPHILTTKTINNGTVSLDDRASNAVTISTTLSPNTLTINFPTATSGKVRDFAMRLNIAAGVTAPEIAWPQGVTLENDGGEVPEIADGGTGGSSTILYFSETENDGTTAKFLVKGETLTAIARA